MSGRPKSEIRNPKEIRRPKAESPALAGGNGDSEFWVWGDQPGSEPIALHDGPSGNNSSPLDLTERTARFGEATIEFAKKIPQNPVNNRLITQLVGAGTSVGANFYEADDAV